MNDKQVEKFNSSKERDNRLKMRYAYPEKYKAMNEKHFGKSVIKKSLEKAKK